MAPVLRPLPSPASRALPRAQFRPALQSASPAQVTAHARRLARRAPTGRERETNPDGAQSPLLAWAMAGPAANRVVTLLALRGPASVEEMAQALDVSVAATARILERLLEEGRVVRADDGRRFRATAAS